MAAHATRNGGPSSRVVTIPKSLPSAAQQRDRSSSQRVRSPAAVPPALRAADPLPEFIAPQLALLVSAPPADEHYVHEIKFDGYRVLARLCHAGAAPQVQLFTRSGNDWTGKFAGIAEAVASLAVESAFVDGEVVALDDQGRSSFQRLQGSLSGRADAPLCYCVFDLLYLNGYDLRSQPLLDRKELLAALLDHNPHPLLRYSEHFTGSGERMFQRACSEHLEGIICKDGRRPYVSSRSTGWLKVKCKNRQEFVIIGYTSPKGSRAHLGALLLAAHEADGRLRYAGRVGTGMGAQTLRELQQRLAALHTAEPPVSGVRGGRDVTWVEPRLVAEIEFSEFTAEKILRHPAFVGLRADKPAAQVVLETPAPPPSPAPRQLAAGRAALPRHRPPARR
ncbi:MAG TPA: non-homologous end-joining DNA ligase [Pseudomonadota bacterium]|nr:non-homologous end-joining DNA ligase [Pseudomonadota bacterium]